jgi:hypothetical protein
MRIAYLVDVHGHFDAVAQATSEIGPLDLLIVGGDITTGGTPDVPPGRSRAGARSPHACSRSPGTWTPPPSTRAGDLGVGLDSRGVLFRDIGVVGVSASPGRRSTPYELDDDELERRFVEREQPDLVLCGHIHESRGTDTIARARTPTPGRPPLGTTRSWR